jgi:hypothetical protein
MTPFLTKTDAAASKIHEFKSGDVPANLVLNDGGNIGDDTISVYYVGSDDSLTTVLDEYGDGFEFSADRKNLPIEFPCKIKVDKAATTSAVGIDLFDNQ